MLQHTRCNTPHSVKESLIVLTMDTESSTAFQQTLEEACEEGEDKTEQVLAQHGVNKLNVESIYDLLNEHLSKQ